MKKVEITSLVKYSNHTVKDNGIVNLCLKANYSELSKTILCAQMLNEDVSVKINIKKSIVSLGSFRIKKIFIDGDGESKLLFMSSSEAVELNNLNKMAIECADGFEFKAKFEANIEDAKDEEEEED